ncbi:tyrosine-type recombinase/integrase [Chenggangzhangella methanolivorans]|uniref:tyrosine-type recombinase/integrase n=1 Tax=Chenggangzhangella methanolivorans TaxID=1437009 RepID=UPI0021BD99A4|nr:tyrosine-type recombinase/integrase [Chenggangzhangella methanolivorans]
MRQPDLFRLPKKPWNAGRLIGPKAPLKPKHIWAIRQQLKTNAQVRDLAMFNCALDAKLRGCDLVKLRISDVAMGGSIRLRSTVMQQKTGRPVPFEITEPARDALAARLRVRGGRPDDWLFPSRSTPGQHIGTRQYARLVDKWVRMIDLEPTAYGTHSLRRTKVSLIYKKTGNLRACQLLLGHGKLESTVRYLGIEVDDALALSEQLEL